MVSGRAGGTLRQGRQGPPDEKTTTHTDGEPAGFIIELENGFKLYHTGDTGLFSDMKLIAEYYKPDLVLLPIGGHVVMDPKDAAYATKDGSSRSS